MNFQWFKVLMMLLEPGVRRAPIRVLRELRKKGKQRLPSDVQKEIESRNSFVRTFSFIRKWLDGEMLSRHNAKWVLNSFLPPFPGRAYDRMFDNLLSGRRLSPVSAYLAITSECLNDCWHCSIKNRSSSSLDTKQWLDIIEKLNLLGTSIIGFTGGEPVLRPDLPDLVASAVKHGAETIVFTSGTGFSEQIAETLAKAGLWALCVSLDDTDPGKFGEMRGNKNAFEQALNAIRISVKTGFYTMVGTVANPESIEKDLYRKIYMLAKGLRVQELNIIEPMRCGALASSHENCFLNDSQIQALRDFHKEVNRKGVLPKICAFNQIESPELFGCGGGTQHLFIDHSGEVCPCDFTPLSFGNASNEDLDMIWSRMNKAMGNPRRHCFIQKHHALIAKFADGKKFPLAPELSEEICREAGSESLPDYFKLVTQHGDMQ